ncbi:hypothetical protein BU23DRAFT_163211 [Bimuria novae-zelandiae CBS 107.79]|uniref:Uncharacterized protein n=1 Tax=Bimuria novae-zelandiae CBS 107.79 TaxID=1447943 RepID=A0A6A5V5S6_9PLEO|nr:hypothetical protein BU23DRAFT_163211 [Bimuria novae-zelandiae CBS 107.79]
MSNHSEQCEQDQEPSPTQTLKDIAGSWYSDQEGKSCPYNPSPEFAPNGTFWTNLERLLSHNNDRTSGHLEKAPPVKIRQWNGHNLQLIYPTAGKDDKRLTTHLEEIAEERQKRFQGLKRSPKGLKWIHLASNDMGWCLVRFFNLSPELY